jgi:hypothetical protein
MARAECRHVIRIKNKLYQIYGLDKAFALITHRTCQDSDQLNKRQRKLGEICLAVKGPYGLNALCEGANDSYRGE